jgi:hypothetical protein
LILYGLIKIFKLKLYLMVILLSLPRFTLMLVFVVEFYIQA